MPTLSPAPPVAPPRRKRLRRALPESSQALRRGLQLGFLALNVWLGLQFWIFVRYYETRGQSMHAQRPAGVEGWLPIASLMNLKVLFLTGELPRIHPAGTLLLLGFLGVSFLFRKSFCGWLCPIGTISEYLWRLGRKLFGRNFRLPRALDIILRSLKYLLLAVFVYVVAIMPVTDIREFLSSPWGIVDDVKMLNFFRTLSLTGGLILIVLAGGSLLIQNFWCRYLCPYGALMGLAALASPLKIRRDKDRCIDCAKCAKACPSALPVDHLITIQSAECLSCMQCITACPAEGALFYAAPAKRKVPAWTVATGVVALLLAVYAFGLWTNHWNTNLPDRIYFELVPHADEFSHP